MTLGALLRRSTPCTTDRSIAGRAGRPTAGPDGGSAQPLFFGAMRGALRSSRGFGPTLAVTGLLSLALVPGAFASAFAINELGTRAQGMGGAFTAIADDGSAIFFNPAGIAFLRGTNFEMHSLVVAGQFRFVPSETPPGAAVPEKGFSGAIQQPFIPVANLYFTHRLRDRWTVGLGAFAPFGLATNFTNFNDGDPANTKYVGRFAGTRAKLINFWFQPTVAYRLSENSAISVGVAYVHTHIFLEQSFFNPYDKPDDFGRSLAREVFPGVDPNLAFRSFSRLLPEGRLRAAASANEPGLTAGYLYKHRASGWSFGASFRTATVNHLKGKASFAFTEGGALTPFLPNDRNFDVLFPNQDIRGTFTTPATYVAGVAKSGVWGGRLAFDFRFQDFKRFKDFPINFTETIDPQGRERATMPEQRLDFDFRNSYLIQTGFEKPFSENFGFGKMRGMFRDATWRAGYVFDYSPVVDKSVGPLFPDANRHSWTMGLTKSVGNVELTLFYQFMQFINRTVTVPANSYQFTNGEYRNFAHLAGAGMRFRLGRDNGVD